MSASQHLWIAASLALSLGCAPPLPPASSGSSESDDGSTGGPTTESSTDADAESESETGGPMPSCTTEWDCGVGERCLDGSCTCLGCACQAPRVAPGTIDAPESDDDERPVFFDVSRPECGEDSDCAPLEYCEGFQCVETTACVEDIDCRADWWPESNRFCIDGLCQGINCYDQGDAACPDGSLCVHDVTCTWLELAPICEDVPKFQAAIVHTLDAPDTATFVILDIDLDDRDDIVVLDNGFIFWLTSNGAGFEPPTPWAVEPGTQILAIGAADIHGDGVDELLVSHAVPLGVEILAAGPSWPQWVGFAETMSVPEAARALDVDFDGLPDIVTGSSVIGPMTLVEAQLGDGTGTFEPLWTEEIEPFEFSQPVPVYDEALQCTRALGALETEALGVRRLHHEGVELGHYHVVDRPTVGHMFVRETPQAPGGFVAASALIDRGVLSFPPQVNLEIAPEPGAVVLLSRENRGPGIRHAIVDHGVEPAEFVEFEGDPQVPLCRGSLGFPLDAVALGVGDFDGDGREDLLSQGTDGVLRTWLSRN